MAAVLALAALGGPRTRPVDLGTLSPPHSDQGDNNNTSTSNNNNNNNSSQGVDKPMDLSSGGGMFTEVAGPTHGGHPLLSARRLADLVRAQHRQSEAAASRLLGDKRKWEEEEEETSGPDTEQGRGAGADLGRERGGSPGLGPGSPAGSSTSSGSEGGGGGGGREEKRRRLDLLLNKKFDRIHSQQQQQEPLVSTPPPSERETSPASDSRRPSTDSCAGEPRPKHRRKQSRGPSVSSSRPGSRPGSPLPNISIRPHSDLFPPAATSTPRAAAKTKPAAAKQSGEEKENKDALKQQLLQVIQ